MSKGVKECFPIFINMYSHRCAPPSTASRTTLSGWRRRGCSSGYSHPVRRGGDDDVIVSPFRTHLWNDRRKVCVKWRDDIWIAPGDLAPQTLVFVDWRFAAEIIPSLLLQIATLIFTFLCWHFTLLTLVKVGFHRASKRSGIALGVSVLLFFFASRENIMSRSLYSSRILIVRSNMWEPSGFVVPSCTWDKYNMLWLVLPSRLWELQLFLFSWLSSNWVNLSLEWQ